MSRRSTPRKAATQEEAVAEGLHSVAVRLLRRLRKEDDRAGVGPARLSVLSVLVFGGPCRMKDLAAAEQVKPPTMSRVVAGLEGAGLVRRETDRRDGRSVRVEATARGRKLLEGARLRRVAVLANRLKRLPAEKLVVIEESVGILKEWID